MAHYRLNANFVVIDDPSLVDKVEREQVQGREKEHVYTTRERDRVCSTGSQNLKPFGYFESTANAYAIVCVMSAMGG